MEGVTVQELIETLAVLPRDATIIDDVGVTHDLGENTVSLISGGHTQETEEDIEAKDE